MTLEQILSPAVMDWIVESESIPKEQVIDEFNKWLIENEEKINESVRNNIDEINECIEIGRQNARLLMEASSVSDDDDDDSWLGGDLDFDDDNGDDDTDDNDTPISGKPMGVKEINDLIDEPELITKPCVLTSNVWEGDKSKSNNIFDVINAVYSKLEQRKIAHRKNSAVWSHFNVSKVKSMAALFAFADIKDADLSSWDTSKVINMEGMFYKSTFNNESIKDWDVSSCVNFKKMFTHSKFKQSITKWSPGFIMKPEYDSDGKIIPGKKVRVQVDLPLIGANADEEDAMLMNYWDGVLSSLPLDESKENNKIMKHILDFNTFVNEGFGDFVKKGIDKIKSVFKNMAIKINNLVAMFDKNGKVIEAVSPYTSLNYISNGKVKGVTAYTAVKNEYLNDNVKSTADIVESPEYYGIIDEDSIEYRNYLTMVEMINEHCSKYGNKLNEDRVGFSSEAGGLNDARDINTSQLKKLIDSAIKSVPGADIGDEDDDEVVYGGALIIFGAPGVGKSTIPNSIIKEWNKNDEYNKKALMVVECGDLTIDGFSLPIPTKATLGEFLDQHPEVKRRAEKMGTYNPDAEYLDHSINVSTEALKTWLPCYKKGSSPEETNLRNDVANGYITTSYGRGGIIKQTESTEGGILLFDEFFRANEQIFKILMQIVLNRSFNNGEYVLGNKWAVLCCSNRPNDDAQVRKSIKNSPGATLGTRFGGGIYNFIPDFNDWAQWAKTKGHFDQITLDFLQEEKDPVTKEYTNWHNIEQDGASKNKLGYPTPRTWSALMKELYLEMKISKYSSFDEIPEDFIRLKAEGIIGMQMADKYIKHVAAKRKHQIKYDEILNNPRYIKPNESDVKCGVVIRGLSNYINVEFDTQHTPKDEQLVNMFNFLMKTYNKSDVNNVGPFDNLIRPLFGLIFNKFGYMQDKKDFCTKYVNFVNAIRRLYKLSTVSDITQFVKDIPEM